MALQCGINSFVSEYEADDYFSNRVNSSAWDNSEQTEEALVTATGILNKLLWLGTSSVQGDHGLAFPRNITYYDSVRGSSVTLTDDRSEDDAGSIPQDIKDATCEMAYHLINNSGLLDDTSKVLDLTVGSIRLTNPVDAPFFSGQVLRIIGKYLEGGSAYQRVVRVGG